MYALKLYYWRCSLVVLGAEGKKKNGTCGICDLQYPHYISGNVTGSAYFLSRTLLTLYLSSRYISIPRSVQLEGLKSTSVPSKRIENQFIKFYLFIQSRGNHAAGQ